MYKKGTGLSGVISACTYNSSARGIKEFRFEGFLNHSIERN